VSYFEKHVRAHLHKTKNIFFAAVAPLILLALCLMRISFEFACLYTPKVKFPLQSPERCHCYVHLVNYVHRPHRGATTPRRLNSAVIFAAVFHWQQKRRHALLGCRLVMLRSDKIQRQVVRFCYDNSVLAYLANSGDCRSPRNPRTRQHSRWKLNQKLKCKIIEIFL